MKISSAKKNKNAQRQSRHSLMYLYSEQD